MKRILGLICVQLFCCTLAQQQLVINGQRVSGLTTGLVPGSAYIQADILADAIGARYAFFAGVASFDFAARVLNIEVYENAAEAGAEQTALSLDGRSLSGTAAVMNEGIVYAPIAPVVRALGGSVTYVESSQTVLVVFPRADVLRATLEPDSGQGYDRFVIEFKGLTAFESYFNRPLGILQIRFDQANISQNQAYEGRYFSTALLQEEAGYLELRLQINPNSTYKSFTTPSEKGFDLVLDVFPAESEVFSDTELSVVIDPGHGGSDLGIRFDDETESSLSLLFSQRLAAALSQRGINTKLTRQGNETLSILQRSQQGVDASLFISVHANEGLQGQYAVYYLGDLTSSFTLRENAEAALATTTDALRRAILLDFVPNVRLGEVYASGIVNEMRQLAGYRGAAVTAPLGILEGPAGRGILLELSGADLADEQLPDTLATAIINVLLQAGRN